MGSSSTVSIIGCFWGRGRGGRVSHRECRLQRTPLRVLISITIASKREQNMSLTSLMAAAADDDIIQKYWKIGELSVVIFSVSCTDFDMNRDMARTAGGSPRTTTCHSPPSPPRPDAKASTLLYENR